MEIFTWYRDCGDPETGKRWMDLALHKFRSIKADDSQARLQLARLLMVQSVSKILSGETGALNDLRSVRAASEDYLLARGNADLWEAMFHLWNNCPGTFCNIIDESIAASVPQADSLVFIPVGVRLSGTTYWPLAHTLLAKADAAALNHNDDERIHFAGLAHDVFVHSEIVPTAFLPVQSLEWYENRHNLPSERRIRRRTATALEVWGAVPDEIYDVLKSM